MLSRGPALLLAPLLLLCRGNPRFRDPDPRVCLFVFSKLFLIILFPPGFYLWFFFLSTGPRRVVGPPPRALRAVGHTQIPISRAHEVVLIRLHPGSPRAAPTVTSLSSSPRSCPRLPTPCLGAAPPGFGRCQRVGGKKEKFEGFRSAGGWGRVPELGGFPGSSRPPPAAFGRP